MPETKANESPSKDTPPAGEDPLQPIKAAYAELVDSHNKMRATVVVTVIGVAAVALTTLAVMFKKMAAAAEPPAESN